MVMKLINDSEDNVKEFISNIITPISEASDAFTDTDDVNLDIYMTLLET